MKVFLKKKNVLYVHVCLWSLLCIFFSTLLKADTGDGRIKFIATANAQVMPIKVHTGRGSFLVDGLEHPDLTLLFSKSHWKTLLGRPPVFFPQTFKTRLTNAGSSYNGLSVAISADGNTVASGAILTDSNLGATYIYTRTGANTWSAGQKLQDSGAPANSWQGASVALSADGNTLAVGGPGDTTTFQVGAVWIYTRTNDVWTQQQKLTASDSVGNSRQGTSVSLSRDGNTLAVGGNRDASDIGATWIYTRINSVWTQQQKILADDSVGNAQQGAAVSLSADGNTLVVGGPLDAGGTGAAWVYTRPSFSDPFIQQGSKLFGNDAVGAARQGESLVISAEGNTFAEAGWRDNSFVGAVWIFVRNNGIWTQQTSKLVGPDAIGSAWQGIGLSFSADGNTLAIGGGLDDGGRGAVWIWIRQNGLWTWVGNKLITSTGGEMGHVALSADGNTLAAGANAGAGEVTIWA